jgi:hypothetical protein
MEERKIDAEFLRLHEDSIRLKIVTDYVENTDFISTDVLRFMLNMGEKEKKENED